MTPTELAGLREQLNTESIRESRHIGLANVNQRIRLLFDFLYDFQYFSTSFAASDREN